MEEGLGFSGRVGNRNHAVDLFCEALGGTGEGVVRLNGCGGVVVERNDFCDGRDELGPGFEKRAAVVAVVENLELLRGTPAVRDGVGDSEGGRAGFCGDLGLEFELRAVEHAFVDAATDADAVGRGLIDDEFDFACGNVADFPVEGEVEGCLGSIVLWDAVGAGVSVAFEAAADHPFVESLEPSESTAAVEVHE